MITVKLVRRGLAAVAMSLVSLNASAQAVSEAQKPQAAPRPRSPSSPSRGQAGKDVIWVPTPQATVDAMLDLAKVTPKDHVIDLGSGNGVTVITAAKRGATAHGVEFNPEMVDAVAPAGEGSRRGGQGDLLAGRPVRGRPVEGHRHHAVPAARHQPAAAAVAARTGTRARGSCRTRSTWATGRPTREATAAVHDIVVQRAAVGRARQGGRHVASRVGHADADPEVPDGRRHARKRRRFRPAGCPVRRSPSPPAARSTRAR